MADVLVRVAGTGDAPVVAQLRARFLDAPATGEAFTREVAVWLEEQGDRRTTWLAERDGAALGMVSLSEYRRMPKPGLPGSRWGYVSNLFVCEEARDGGVGASLLDAVIAAADERGHARLVLSAAERAIPFYERAGFLVPDGGAGTHRLLVRPAGAGVAAAARPRG